MSANASRLADAAERVLSIRKLGSGWQYEIKWRGQKETTWEAASRVKRQNPELVRAFEESKQPEEEGTKDNDEPMYVEAVVAEAPSAQPGASQQSGMSLQQVQALEQLVREQAQQLRKQEQLLASSAHSPQLSVQPSPQLSPHQEPRRIAASAAAAAGAPAAESVSRFAKKEPRAQDLREYDGASGSKLDEWQDELALASMLYQLNSREAVTFLGVVRRTEGREGKGKEEGEKSELPLETKCHRRYALSQ